MALPKRKISRQRRDTRRATHNAKPPAMVECPHCHSLRLPHHVCPNCGMYRGRHVVQVEEE